MEVITVTMSNLLHCPAIAIAPLSRWSVYRAPGGGLSAAGSSFLDIYTLGVYISTLFV